MGYYIDISTISIDDYKTKLESAYLPPSRKMLRERLDERFNRFKDSGINNVQELVQTLKKKDECIEFSKIECLSRDYLKILLRELNSMLPKPNRLKEFSGISPLIIEKLEKIGIKNTVKLFDKVRTAKSRRELIDSLCINENEVLVLTKLTDLSRIRWVGVTFARMLYDLGFDTVEKASKVDPVDLHA